MPIVGNNYQLVSDRPDNGEPGDAAQIEAILQDISSALNEILSRIENFNVDFSNIDNRPTTLAGYGITDALPVGYVDAPMRAAVNNNASDLADILDNIDRSPAGLTEAMISSLNDFRSRTILRAKSTNAEALVLEEKSARILGDTALASDITFVGARADEATAEGLVKLEAVAAPGGVTARFGTFLRANIGDSWTAQAAEFIEVTPSGSRKVIRADRTVIEDNGGNILAMFDGTGAFFNNARITNLTAAQIAANTITTNEIAANTIRAANIELNGVTLGNSASVAFSSLTTTTSTSWTLMSGMSVAVTVAANAKLLIIASVAVTGPPDQISVQVAQDGVGIGGDDTQYGFWGNANEVGGAHITLVHLIEPGAGTFTYSLEWQKSGAGTATARTRQLVVTQFYR